MGWDEFWNLSNVLGSKILTLDFLSTLRITKEKIYFRVLNSEFDLPWDAFSTCLSFDIPNIKIEHATKHMNKKEFWYDITGENYEGWQPRTSHICNPILVLMHQWIGLTLFPRDDLKNVREIDTWILFAMVHKIPISPVVEMAKHWIWASSQPKRWTIEFTSVVTKFCARLNLLNNFDKNITTPRVVLHKRFYIQGHYLTGGANNTVFLKVYNTHEIILLPYEELKIYSGNPLLPMCKRHMRHAGPTTRGRA